MKRITISISDSMYEEIKTYIGDLAPTKNGIIWILLEHGLNYEWKKHRKKEKEKQQHPQNVTADQDQEDYNNKFQNMSKEEQEHLMQIIKTPTW